MGKLLADITPLRPAAPSCPCCLQAVLPPSGSPGRPGVRSVVEGFRFLGTRPNLHTTFVIDLVAMVLAQPRALMPAIGAVMIGGGEATVGVLLASTAVGAFLADLFSGPLGGVRRQGSAVVSSVMGWGASMAAFGLVVLLAGRAPDGAVIPWLVRAAVCCALAGIADSINGVFRHTILQAATPDYLRGRLQGVFIVAAAGGPRIGDLLAGGLPSAGLPQVRRAEPGPLDSRFHSE